MNVIFDKNDVNLMRREVIGFVNQRYYFYIFLCVIVAAILIVKYFHNRKKISFLIFLYPFVVLYSIINITQNINKINDSFSIYDDYNKVAIKMEVLDSALVIDNITLNKHTVIYFKDIKRIIYKPHTVIIYTADNYVHSFPKNTEILKLMDFE